MSMKDTREGRRPMWLRVLVNVGMVPVYFNHKLMKHLFPHTASKNQQVHPYEFSFIFLFSIGTHFCVYFFLSLIPLSLFSLLLPFILILFYPSMSTFSFWHSYPFLSTVYSLLSTFYQPICMSISLFACLFACSLVS